MRLGHKPTNFHQHEFLNVDGSTIEHTNEVIVEKFKDITGIVERRYADSHLTSSDLAAFAAERAIADANIDPEELDYIIMAHNFQLLKMRSESILFVRGVATFFLFMCNIFLIIVVSFWLVMLPFTCALFLS